MLGKNPILKTDHGSGLRLRLVKGSPFLTIQGEGPYMGHPAVFVRLHGCNLACTFCDTDFSDPDDPVWYVDDIMDRIKEIADGAKLVVITGGEPFRQNIKPLCRTLSMLRFTVQIETAGTLWIDGIEPWVRIICSPKTPMIHPQIRRHAAAFKYVIDADMEFDRYLPITATQAGVRPVRLAEPRDGVPIFLSPMDTGDDLHNTRNRKVVAQLAMEYGCVAGLQMHKFMGVD